MINVFEYIKWRFENKSCTWGRDTFIDDCSGICLIIFALIDIRNSRILINVYMFEIFTRQLFINMEIIDIYITVESKLVYCAGERYLF
jgi:hypothetical protein